MSKIGNVTIKLVNEESKQMNNDVTEKPIENGQDIADHINHKPLEITFDFAVIGDNAEKNRDKLIAMRDADEVYEYFDVKNLRTYTNMAITALSFTDNKRAVNGFFGRMTLKQVRLVVQESTEINLGRDPVTGNQPQSAPGETETRSSKTEGTDENTIKKSVLTILTGG